jgi:uncharacterized protein YndB with AHSA1/START domain
MTNRIEHDTLIEAPIEHVWRLLTQPEHVAAWYAFDGAQIDLRVGGALVFTWKEHGAYRGRVERVEPPHVFAFRFAGHVPDVEPAPGNSTLVEFRLEREGQATRVRVTESGFDELSSPDEGGVAKGAISLEGWRGGLDALRAYAVR